MFSSREDHNHDYLCVQHCIAKTIEYLIQEVGLEIEKQIQFSDGAPTQYKSKYSFVDMSMSQENFGHVTETHFFGSRHGKGPCDGEAGVIKRNISSNVATRSIVVSNAKEKLTLQSDNETDQNHIHSKRILFIKTGDIERNRPEITG